MKQTLGRLFLQWLIVTLIAALIAALIMVLWVMFGPEWLA